MKERSFSLDLVRCIAVIFVVCVHYFLNIGFYKHSLLGEGMFVSLFLRWIFYSAVPLFILLTGYLKRTKKLTKNYYKGIIHVLISYIFISLICIIYRNYYLGQDINLLYIIVSIGNFSADGYSWYIEMFIGLFLLIPFLNILYASLKTKKNKQILIASIILVLSFSPLINYIRVGEYNLEIIPTYWNEFYPILYYFIGCYLSEYQPKLKGKKYALGIMVYFFLILMETAITYFYNYGELFSWSFFGGYNSLNTVIISTLLFVLLYNIKSDNKIVKSIAKSISSVALDIYLFSWIVDNFIYPYVLEYITVPLDYLKYFIPTVIIIFLLSYILALVKKGTFTGFKMIALKMRKK